MTEDKSADVMLERRTGYAVGWWMFWIGFVVGVCITLALVGLTIGVEHFQ